MLFIGVQAGYIPELAAWIDQAQVEFQAHGPNLVLPSTTSAQPSNRCSSTSPTSISSLQPTLPKSSSRATLPRNPSSISWSNSDVFEPRAIEMQTYSLSTASICKRLLSIPCRWHLTWCACRDLMSLSLPEMISATTPWVSYTFPRILDFLLYLGNLSSKIPHLICVCF